MKISFLCSSFEPGRDGVGDYVAQFVRALSRRGHDCQIVAVCDKYVATACALSLDGLPVEVIRIPAEHWQSGRLDFAETALRRFDPDWTSLQMVSYGYESRGLLLRSAARLAKLRIGRNRHLMFHELWIGETLDYGIKDRAVGWLQKQLLLRAARVWSPTLMHTSNPTYRARLLQSGVVADELPLPGNIRIVAVPASAARRWVAERLGHAGDARELFIAGVFGAIHPYWAEFSWLRRLATACETSGRRLVMLQIGRKSGIGGSIWNALRSEFDQTIRCVELGEMPERDVSLALQGIDLGVSTSPWELVGKSGAVAAMLEHGLPVVVTMAPHRLRSGATPGPVPHPLLHRFDDEFLALVGSGVLRRADPRPVEHVYDQFIDSLARAEGMSAAVSASFAS